MSTTTTSKGDPNPKDYEKLYYDLLDNMDNLGFQIALNAKNAKAQYILDKQAREAESQKQKAGLEGIGKP
jgi:hypothetical protein